MKKIITCLVFTLILNSQFSILSFAGPAEDAYQQAHECYVNLQSNIELQKRRDQWETCIRQFEDIVKKYRRHGKGADAKFSLGKLYAGLASNSKNRADWFTAVKEYESFARQYSRNSMADDAYLSAAKIYWERLGDKKRAEADLRKVIKFYKTSDSAGEAERYLGLVKKGIVPPQDKTTAAAAKEKPVVIVIDPGHGGSDTGAVGPDGAKEKDITLQLSRLLTEKLKNAPNIRVYLTRNGDETLTLNQRTRVSNARRADLFVSIHANASVSKNQRGIQTYYLNNATDAAAERLAAQENENAGRKISDLEKIIATMIQNESTERSQELAGLVHKSLVDGLSKKYTGIVDQNVRSALFYVLVGSKCPSILLEVSYISNKKEERRLEDKNYQNAVASAVAGGLQKYIGSSRL